MARRLPHAAAPFFLNTPNWHEWPTAKAANWDTMSIRRITKSLFALGFVGAMVLSFSSASHAQQTPRDSAAPQGERGLKGEKALKGEPGSPGCRGHEAEPVGIVVRAQPRRHHQNDKRAAISMRMAIGRGLSCWA